LIKSEFNIHVGNEKDWYLHTFLTLLELDNTCQNKIIVVIILLIILSHEIDVDGIGILQQSDDISDHYLVSCTKLHLAKAAIFLLQIWWNYFYHQR